MKIQYDQSILTTEERIEAQELLFSMGFAWCDGARVQNQEADCVTAWGDSLYFSYNQRNDYKIVTLAELRELANPWREVAKVGFPKETDYPVFVWQEGKHVGYALRDYEGVPDTLKASEIMHYSLNEDATITHWKRAPRIVAPEPPVVKQSKDVPPKGYRLYAPDEVIQSGEDQFYWDQDDCRWILYPLPIPYFEGNVQKNAKTIYACPKHWEPQRFTMSENTFTRIIPEQYRTITIEGKEYLASEVKERLAQLKPIN